MPGISAPSAVNTFAFNAAQHVDSQQQFLTKVRNNELTFKQIHDAIKSNPDFLQPLIARIENKGSARMLAELSTLMKFYKDDLKGALESLVGNPANRAGCVRLTDKQQHAFIALVALPEHARTVKAFFKAGVFSCGEEEEQEEEENYPIFNEITSDDSLYLWLKRGLPCPNDPYCAHPTPSSPKCAWYPVNMRYADMSGLTLNHHNFSGCDMRGTSFDRSSLYKCNIDDSYLLDATIDGGDIERCYGNPMWNDRVCAQFETVGYIER